MKLWSIVSEQYGYPLEFKKKKKSLASIICDLTVIPGFKKLEVIKNILMPATQKTTNGAFLFSNARQTEQLQL